MGRWRPAGEQGAPYITAAGYAALEDETQVLWKRRREVVRHLAAAAAEGDRSENAEYQYRKKELREIDRRIRYLEKRMPQLEIVTALPEDRQRVFFGAMVELEDQAGQSYRYRLVGGDEAQPESGAISIDSPLAKRLLGRHLDDAVESGSGELRYIVAIAYSESGA